MQPKETLEITGNLSEHSLVELLTESSLASLNGSFRLSSQQFKAIIYLREGSVVLAASNSLRHRLSELLIGTGEISREQIGQCQPFANDHDLAHKLIEKNLLAKNDLDAIFSYQLKDILTMALDLSEGEWVYSPFARAKADIGFSVEMNEMFIHHSRKLSLEEAQNKIDITQEVFSNNRKSAVYFKLNPQEEFILSRIDEFASVDYLTRVCGMPANMISQSLYTLWVSGLVSRTNFKSIFTDDLIERFKSSNFQISEKPIQKVLIETKVEDNKIEPEILTENNEENLLSEDLSMDNYLKLVEGSADHYSTLGLTEKADLSDIKKVYFQMAKLFHPDKFHNEEDALKKRIQNAFTNIAQAYDTLKRQDSRELYDFRLRRRRENAEIAAEEATENLKNGEKPSTEPVKPGMVDKIQLAKNYFNKGFDLLMSQEEEKAVAFLANAVNLDDTVARYHAYYGKSLMSNKKFRHQAEHEMQAAIKLEPENVSFKIMLIEFYIEVGLMKRADGELTRFIAAYPDNKEARSLLDKIVK